MKSSLRFALPSPALLLLLFLLASPGCIVIPVGDLLRGPALEEQVLVEGAGFFSKDKIAVIDLDGVIRGAEEPSLFSPGENVLAETIAELDMARDDPQVKAVVLRISSPGGEVTACDILHREIRKFREETRVPVIASIADLGTSGAYYVAVASDAIYAHPTSTVGSIGVVLHHFNLAGLMGKIGVESSPVKSAPMKDINSLFRPMTEGERNVLQKLVDDMYERFVSVVVAGRPALKPEEARAVADGRVVSGGEALKLKLVDKVGYLQDAIEEARARSQIESPTIVRYARSRRSGANVYSESGLGVAASRGVELSIRATEMSPPKLYYIWQPGV
jgi:protease-4